VLEVRAKPQPSHEHGLTASPNVEGTPLDTALCLNRGIGLTLLAAELWFCILCHHGPDCRVLIWGFEMRRDFKILDLC
jgi:hypothetical protein